jgi:CspA family cold shock protein
MRFRQTLGTPAGAPGEQHTGTVRWYHVSRGYGFIRPDVGGADVFVHFSAVITDGFQALGEQQRVGYVLAEGSRGLQATQVRVLPADGHHA